ncbi:MAG: tRNA-dihydrouridine synthase [Patescibacteria group bacterium]
MKNFWNTLPKPFFVLAPLADVTDVAFRGIIAKYGKPDVMWTEFVSADGLVSKEGREHLMIDLAYTESERPIVAQLFTSKPENMRKAAKIILELGFDGLDINMGCPDRTIEKQGAGAALIKSEKLAREIIRAAKEGVEDKIPVSVKTRVGYNQDILEEWLGAILEEKPAALTVHARTRKEMSKVPARWEAVERAVKLRDFLQGESLAERMLIIGNGDVKDLADAETKARETGADGVMLGRAIFGNPWLFDKKAGYQNIKTKEKLEVMVEHTNLFEKLLGGKKNFSIMKKHYKAYANGFNGAKELRTKLMEAGNADEVEDIVNMFLKL